MTNEEANAVLKEKYCGIGSNDLFAFRKAFEALEKAEKKLERSAYSTLSGCVNASLTLAKDALWRIIAALVLHLIFLKRTTKPSSSGVTNIRRRPTRKTSLRNFRMHRKTYPEIQFRVGRHCSDLRTEIVVQETVPIAGTNACRR